MAAKFYVVWAGHRPGIYTTWAEAKQQVDGFKGAKFKSFPSKAEAEAAYKAGFGTTMKAEQRAKTGPVGDYIVDSICVDAACSGNPGLLEYRGVYTKTGEQIFHVGPLPNGTNNLGEFMAIVHGLAWLKQNNLTLPIYSDSQTAIKWVKQKKANTTIERNEKTAQVWAVVDRAMKWLQTNSYTTDIYKWETETWGEIKADFGRK